jgi:hypothetical protein
MKAFPDCPIIHWAFQIFDDPKLCFCPCSIDAKPWRDLTNITIHHDHVRYGTAMTPNQLMKHLSDQGDPTHKAIYIYFKKIESFPTRVLQDSIQPRI